MRVKPGMMGQAGDVARGGWWRCLAGRSVGRWLATLALGAMLAGCGAADDPTYPTPNPAQDNLNTGPGDYYKDFLAASPYSKLRIEIDVMDGAMPEQDAVDTLVADIKLLCNKPGGVEVLFPDDTIPADPDAGENPEYTLDEIEALEQEYRDYYRGDDTAVMYFLYVDGHSDFDDPDAGTQVLGYAYHGSSMAIFMGTINSKLPIARGPLVKTVTVHEFGHIIGLVDNGAEMQSDHLDPDTNHGSHCDNPDCMMFWANNSSDILDAVINGEIPDFDDACLADIHAAGGLDATGVDQPDRIAAF